MPRVFPEYAGAFAFLFRDWAAAGCLDLAGTLLERGQPWLVDVMTAFLLEQARTDYVPGRGSPAAESAARALSQSGGSRTADSLAAAGHRLMATRLARAATTFYEAAVALQGVLYRANPENVEISVGLGASLNDLGALQRASGRARGAETSYRRSGEILEALWQANPGNDIIGGVLGTVVDIQRA